MEKDELQRELIYAEGKKEYFRTLLAGRHWFGADFDRAMFNRYSKRVEIIRELLSNV